LLALRTSKSHLATDVAHRAARDLYGLNPEVSSLAGERDRNFRLQVADGGDYVLKIIDTAADAAAADCQVRVLRYLAEEFPSLPVPRIFATQSGADVGCLMDRGTAHATLLISWLAGRPLGTSRPRTSLLKNFASTLARIDRALLGFFNPAPAQSLAWDVRQLPVLAGFGAYLETEALRRRVLGIAAALSDCLPAFERLRSQTIHGDCHGSNVLVDSEARRVTGVVDFGDMLHAPLIFEIAVAMSELLTEGIASLADLPGVLQSYAAEQRLQVAEVERLYDVMTARHAVTLLVHAWRCRHDPAGAGALELAAANAGRTLELLTDCGRDALTRTWHDAAGTLPPSASLAGRRRGLLGAGAELFYEQPLHLVRGEGVWLYDQSGRRYLDVYNNVPHVGHAHPTVIAAIERQSALLNTHTRYLHEAILDYAEQLITRLPAHLDTCIFVNSGSEANDVAWRIAQSSTGNKGALVMEYAYHGITDAVAALTPSPGRPRDSRVETLQAPPCWLGVHDTPNARDLAQVGADAERALGALRQRGFAPAAFYLDSAFTSNGIFDPPPQWLAEIVARARAAGALIVADEVQYGLGRSGSNLWGFERRGLVPDIVTMGKPVGNGFPLGVVVANRQLVEEFQARFGFFSTFGGNPVAAAAGIAVLQVLDQEQLVGRAHATGRYLSARLAAVSAGRSCLGQVRGVGLLLGLEVFGPGGELSQLRAKRFVNALAERHAILTGTEGPMGAVLKLRPPMVFAREHADLLAAAIDAVAADLDSSPD
jgi:4-aminobutyrate aminotransferase-like enzyme/Ser/Thr protein kinase RdoA (MazF antagonist)